MAFIRKNMKLDLSTLVEMDNPQSVFEEVKIIARMMFPEFDFKPLGRVFEDTVKLFAGDYPGYRGCNTEYHDLRHTTDVFLATARLVHGVHISGYAFSKETFNLGLIGALMHDVGYIQTDGDNEGTGAKYTLIHVWRSIEFMERYFRENGFAEEDCEKCRSLIKSSALELEFKDIPFGSDEIEMMGKILLAADLLGQMADRLYLEKLLFLVQEFSEGHVKGYNSELDLLEKTIGFYEMIRKRFSHELGNVDKHMQGHFKARWNIDSDLYKNYMENNIKYLKYLLDNHTHGYRGRLRRGGVVEKLEKLEKNGH